jgi:hypothetical protein
MRLLLPLACLTAALAAGEAPPAAAGNNVYQAPSPEPTVAETVILELINRCRADPTAESLRMVPPGTEPHFPAKDPIDFAMFHAEMAKLAPAPPLVFNLQLLDAARKHAHYMILHTLGHDETPGEPGFTGANPFDRMKAAGYGGGMMAENAFRDAPDPWGSQVGFVIDWGPGGPGGMQPGRGHRANICNPGFTEIGPGAVPHGGNLSVVHNLGHAGKRFAGGVILVDRNRDGWYDPGEGRGGIEIAVGGMTVKNWTSGAYAIELPVDAVVLEMRGDGKVFRRAIPAGSANLKIDWYIPQAADLAAVDRLLNSAKNDKDPESASARKTRTALLLGTANLGLDPERADRVTAVVGDLASRLEADHAAVRLVLDSPIKEFKAVLKEKAKPWSGSAAAGWFDDAERCARAKAVVAEMSASNPPPSPGKLAPVIKELRAWALAAKNEFGPRIGQYASQLDALGEAAGKTKKK